ncbi:MAG TPA: ribokinase [Acidimicrobiia bacterium]|nr:ribokinase [Acidimicrobiia bacterium]
MPPNVAVVGSVNLDLVASCPRLPRPGETVSAVSFDRYPGGKGANQALAARRAGADVTLVAAVGDDPEADSALALLSADGLDLSRLVIITDSPTGLALIAVDAAGENQIVVVPGANHALRPEMADAAGFEAVLCQLEIPLETVAAAAATATGLFCVNAAPAHNLPEAVLERADVIIVNETERDALADSLAEIPALVVVTLGAAGAKAYRNGRLVAERQPPPVDPVDTVGAGDAFCGALVTALAGGAGVQEAMTWAVTAGALATTRHGAQPSLPTRDEIERGRP